jgi:hypothetical protein
MSGDVKAKKKLQAAHAEQRQAELESEDLISAIAGANREIVTLRAEREESTRAEATAEFEVLAKPAIKQAYAIENHVESLVSLLTEHDRTLGKLTALANAAGHQKKFRFAACRRGILYKLAKALPHEYSRPRGSRRAWHGQRSTARCATCCTAIGSYSMPARLVMCQR